MRLVLDQAALNALAGPPTQAQRQVRRAMTAALRTRRDVTVPTVILAEVYRGAGRNQMIDALLPRRGRSARTPRHRPGPGPPRWRRTHCCQCGLRRPCGCTRGGHSRRGGRRRHSHHRRGGPEPTRWPLPDDHRRTTPVPLSKGEFKGCRLSLRRPERDSEQEAHDCPIAGRTGCRRRRAVLARFNPLGILTPLLVVGDPGVEGPGEDVSIPWGF